MHILGRKDKYYVVCYDQAVIVETFQAFKVFTLNDISNRKHGDYRPLSVQNIVIKKVVRE